MKKTALALAVLLFGCTDNTRTIDTLEKSGYSEIQTTGYEMWGCSDSDTFQTGFRARNPAGKVVTGVVCCGYLKGCTVRF